MTEQNRENGLLARGQSIIRDGLLAVFGNEALFLILAFLYGTLSDNAIVAWYQEPLGLLYSYILVPWGVALCLLRLQRRTSSLEPVRADVATLFVLYLWILIPFAIRFGFTFKNASAWYSYAVMYFGIYASVSERRRHERETLLATLSVTSAIFAYVFCGMLLFCAWSGTVYATGLGAFSFGVVNGWLCSGVHYNITGMIALGLCMMCVMGVGYHKNVLLKLFCLIPAVMSMLVIILTQSRTSRYALLAALAIMAFDGVRRVLARRNAVARELAAGITALVVLAGGYWGMARLTQTAIAHYNQLAYDAALQQALAEAEAAQQAAQAETSATETAAEQSAETGDTETMAEQATEPNNVETQEVQQTESNEQPAADKTVLPEVQVNQVKSRDFSDDGSFSNRTDTWKAVFQTWRDNPKMMLIGNGVNQTGSKIGKYISWAPGGVAVHNTYLQWAADFGLIGLAIQLVFLILSVWQTLRVFFSSRRPRGALGLCMTVLVSLIVGLMESAPLSAMMPINLMFMFALAQLSSMQHELSEK